MKMHFNDVRDSVLDVKYEKRTDVFTWGSDNAHPSLLDTLISQSVSAKLAVSKASAAIHGRGLSTYGDEMVNSQGHTLNQVWRMAAIEFVKFGNAFIHVTYNLLHEIDSITVLPSRHVRVGKADDKGYSGKFVVYDNWDKVQSRKIDPKKFNVVDRFNPRKNVVESQINKAGGIKDYRGQILHIHEDIYNVYSLSDLTPVMSEALVEFNSSKFRANGSRKGFLGAKLLAVKPFASEEERDDFIDGIENVQGADNAGKMMLLESSQVSDDISKEFSLSDLSTPYNDTLFEYSDKQARKNISLAYRVPVQLIDLADSTLFGQSGEFLRQMRVELWESREAHRDFMLDHFKRLLKNFAEFPESANVEVVEPNNLESVAEIQTGHLKQVNEDESE